MNGYCENCESFRSGDLNKCDGCVSGDPPTNFKEKIMMTVTIISSSKNKTKAMEVEEYFKKLNCKVLNPFDPIRSSFSLLHKQRTWIQAIEDADLIVVIPKEEIIVDGGSSDIILKIGESVSYEMAISISFNKRIMFWY